jgi:hypothetical protein
LNGIEWAQTSGIRRVRDLGTEDTIAQVHPKLLCEALFKETMRLAPKSKIVKGKVESAVYSDSDSKEEKEKLLGARVEGTDEIIEGDALLFACGPWTADIMSGIKYHSVVVPTNKVLSQCVFFSGCGKFAPFCSNTLFVSCRRG